MGILLLAADYKQPEPAGHVMGMWAGGIDPAAFIR
jgi:hypothetical protein